MDTADQNDSEMSIPDPTRPQFDPTTKAFADNRTITLPQLDECCYNEFIEDQSCGYIDR